MKALAFTVLALVPSLAAAGEGAFRDAFRSYVEMRRLEEKTQILEQRADLDEGDRTEMLHEVTGELAQAKSAFEHARSADLSPWERAVVKHAAHKGDDKAALDFLSRNYASVAHGWSALEWQCAGEWFGRNVQDSFLKITFAMEEAGGKNRTGTGTLLWISDPFARFLSKDEATRDRSARARIADSLRKQGYSVEELDLTAYSHLDEQAEELSLALESRLDKGPITLLSSGHGSTVLMRTFDLHPRLLANTRIRGWANVNGKLFGEAFTGARAPASVSRADRPLSDARLDLMPLREERLQAQTPLSPKFPVVNIVSLGGGARPGASLRDSLVAEGKTFFVRSGDAFGALDSVLGARVPAGQRDVADEPGL